jgi:tetratricopeptide (TPR) repeat protein
MAGALRHWARAIGAARSGQTEEATSAVGELESIAAELQDADSVWARNTSEVLRREAAAWLALARDDEQKALELMRSAAALEDETDKSGLSPGRVLPAHEMLADMLLQLGRPAQALAEYETSAEHAPQRYNTYLGAARAAVEAKQPEKARTYYERLLELVVPESSRAGVEEAKSYLQAPSA